MDEIDIKLLRGLEKGISLTKEPFSEIANQLGITQEDVISRLNRLKKEGAIRRFGASIKPNSVGFAANALVAWRIPQDRVQEVAAYLSKLPEVSHCYERKIVVGTWEYNLYTVMHAHERESVSRMVDQISVETQISEYKILFSRRDLKRINSRRINNPRLIQDEALEESSGKSQETRRF